MRAVRFCAMPDMRLEPSASMRARSTASNTARAGPDFGARRACSLGSWQAAVKARLSAQPRTTATSLAEGTRDGSGSCTSLPSISGLPGAKVTCTSPSPAMARTAKPSTRLNGSAGDSLRCGPAAIAATFLAQRHVGSALGKFLTEAALVELRHQWALELVALVQEGEAEGKADVAENLAVFGPGEDRARAHDRGQIPVHEGRARQVGDADHVGDDLTLGLALVERLGLS